MDLFQWHSRDNKPITPNINDIETTPHQDIEKKYPGFIHQKLLQGIKLSHQLQHVVGGSSSTDDSSAIVRGFRVKNEGELPSALNGYLYSILKSTKAQRRGILTSLLKQFDDIGKVREQEIMLHDVNHKATISDLVTTEM